MTREPSRRLQPIRHIADGRAQQAARQLVECRRQEALAESRLAELRAYLRDYGRSTQAPDPRLLENRFAFLARLREAENFQAGAVSRAQVTVAEQRRRWLEQQRELQRLDRLAALYSAREHRNEERRAQKLMDEFAARRRGPQPPDKH
jgi:flagellar protein FliJ